jgi:hypothetical protein
MQWHAPEFDFLHAFQTSRVPSNVSVCSIATATYTDLYLLIHTL